MSLYYGPIHQQPQGNTTNAGPGTIVTGQPIGNAFWIPGPTDRTGRTIDPGDPSHPGIQSEILKAIITPLAAYILPPLIGLAIDWAHKRLFTKKPKPQSQPLPTDPLDAKLNTLVSILTDIKKGTIESKLDKLVNAFLNNEEPQTEQPKTRTISQAKKQE